MTDGMVWLTIFVLSVFVGVEVISKVSSTLHTPLMSGANAIHGIILLGAVLVTGQTESTVALVVGLVAIPPGAGFVSVGPSIAIGFIAALISNVAVRIRTKSDLDDTLDVFPCHGVGGISGMILTAVFANEGGLLTTGEFGLFGVHLAALVGVSIFAFGGSWVLFKITGAIIPLRVKAGEEAEGLDLSQHGERIVVG